MKSSVREIRRIQVPLYTFNLAIGGGLPVKTRVEISGPSYSGKSTLSYYLAGIVAKPKNTIALCDFETDDDEYPQMVAHRAGWNGKLWVAPTVTEKGDPMSNEEMLDATADIYLADESVTALILDAVGAIFTVAEDEGSVADASMGKRASVVKRFVGKLNVRSKWKKQDSVAFLINHVHDLLGKQGSVTSGGKAMEYNPAIRIRLWAEKKDEYWTLKGTVFKRRYIKDRTLPSTFEVISIPGLGIHPGMTAVNDCILMGLAKQAHVVSLKGKSYGFMSKMADRIDDPKFFQPFYDAIKKGN